MYSILAYTGNAEIICTDCYSALSKKQKEDYEPLFEDAEYWNDPGEGLGCMHCLEWIEERTEEYTLMLECKRNGYVGVIVDSQDTCLKCAIAEGVTSDDINPDTTILSGVERECYTCGKHLTEEVAQKEYPKYAR